MLEKFKDNEKFYCLHYKCYFFDTGCDQRGLKENLGNFTLRLTDSLGYTFSPDIYLVEGVYKIGDEIQFKTCDVQIFGNFADQNEYVLGDIFADTYYVMYDYAIKQVGFNGYVLEGLPVIEEKKE